MSHTQRMDMQTDRENAFTNEKTLTITSKDAEEFCAYKRQKKLTEIYSAIAHAELRFEENSDAQTICAIAEKYKLASVKMPLSALSLYGAYFARHGVACDCVIGGTGETLAAVKALEAKFALKYKAKEITVTVAPSVLHGARYAELRKELKKLRRVAKKAYLKVRLEGNYPYALISKLARMCAEERMDYLSIPYFVGCEKIRADLFGGCLLEISGVENLLDFKKMIGAGVGRIVCNHISALRAEWMKEVEAIQFPVLKKQEEQGIKTTETEKPKLVLTPALPLLAPKATEMQKKAENA